jgi:hypothetical protein
VPNTAYDLNTIANFYYHGTISVDPYGFGGAAPYYNMGNYLGRTYYTLNSTGSGVSATFPSSTLGLFAFYGTSPINEWGGGGGGK